MAAQPFARLMQTRICRRVDGCKLPGTRMTLGQLAGEVAEQVENDHVTVLAGNVAFRLMFAILPVLVSLLWLIRLLDVTGLDRGVLDLATLAFPGPAIAPIREQFEQAPGDQARGAITPGVAIALAVTVWAVVIAFRATMHALNEIYHVDDDRSQAQRTLVSLLASLGAIAMLLAALILVVWGGEIADSVASRLGLGLPFQLGWYALSWLVIVACVATAVTATYYFAPDVEQEFRWVRVGTLFTIVLWLGFTLLFSLYVNILADPQETYGALAGIAVFMLYLYGCTFIVLVGAELNQVVESHDPEGKDTGEKAPDESPSASPAREQQPA